VCIYVFHKEILKNHIGVVFIITCKSYFIRRHISIDNLCSQFNLTLMELKIENAKAFVLGRGKSLEDVR
jgi:hypothetical protein